jgi:hypothetical protein
MNEVVLTYLAGAGVAGLMSALLALYQQRRQRNRSRRDLEALRGSMERQQMACLEMFSEVNRSLTTLEDGVKSLRETPKSGSLNRSIRTQALQLLRSGQSSDAAASSLGLGRRETRLLERVSQTLCGN